MARKRVESRIRMTPIRREQLLSKCGGRCCHCGCELTLGDNFSIEHVIPLNKGGSNDFRNTVALCKPCNLEKGDDIVGADFYSYAPKLILEEISQLMDEYYENNDWLTATNVFKHDRYIIKTEQSIMLANGKIYTKPAECELRKMPFEDYEAFIENIEYRKSDARLENNSSTIEVSNEGQPFQILFKKKPVAALFCGLDAQKDRTVFRVVVTVSKDTNWGGSSRGIIVDCIVEALMQFKESVEAKGTKAIVLTCIDAAADDKRGVSVIETLSRIFESPKSILADVETGEAAYVRTSGVMIFGFKDSEAEKLKDENFDKISKLYCGQLRRRIGKNA